jgi:hypothetical protein
LDGEQHGNEHLVRVSIGVGEDARDAVFDVAVGA